MVKVNELLEQVGSGKVSTEQAITAYLNELPTKARMEHTRRVTKRANEARDYRSKSSRYREALKQLSASFYVDVAKDPYDPSKGWKAGEVDIQDSQMLSRLTKVLPVLQEAGKALAFTSNLATKTFFSKDEKLSKAFGLDFVESINELNSIVGLALRAIDEDSIDVSNLYQASRRISRGLLTEAMITYHCAKCDKDFDADDKLTSAKCPDCGAVGSKV
jgi:hypothetical protein